MRRSRLLAIMALGGVVTLTGGSGIFAAFTDRANTGTNTFTSAEQPRVADVQLASASGPAAANCGTFAENLTTGLFTMTDQEPGSTSTSYACLRNVGADPVTVATSAFELVDVDVDCTGDEAEAGDATCGGNQAGELAPRYSVAVAQTNCADETANTDVGASRLDALSATPLTAFALAKATTACLKIVMTYEAVSGNEHLVAQSDQVTWRFAFTATA